MWNEQIGMSLGQALHILCEVHTDDHADVGFVVHMGAMPSTISSFSQSEYVNAWKIVRQAAGLRTDPAPD